ncbi:MAG: hypothetical protein ACKVU4_10425 [Phycisphaerales bacterium]
MSMACAAALIAAAGMATAASAGPGTKAGGEPKWTSRRVQLAAPVGGGMGPDGGPFTDNFDTYANGSAIAGQGGWELWYLGGQNGSVTNAQASSPPHSLSVGLNTDVVQRFTVADGKWVFKIKTFVPSNAAPGAGGYVILMNQYAQGVDNWSVQVGFNDLTFGTTTIPFLVESQWDNNTLPLVLGQWVEFRSEIDLVADQVTNFYNNQQLGVPHLWTDNGFGAAGITSIACVDLWSPNSGPMYFDDVSLTPNNPCYPDCNASGSLTVADFGCFQGKYVLGDLYADCNASGTLTVADFGCFQGKYVLGCP